MHLGAKKNPKTILVDFTGHETVAFFCQRFFFVIFLVISAFSNFLYSLSLVSVGNVSPQGVLDFQNFLYLAS